MSILLNTLSHGSFFRVNKTLIDQLDSFMAAALLTDLIDRYRQVESKNLLDEDGGFYAASEYIEKDLRISKDIRQKLSLILVDHGMISIKKKGIPPHNFYYLNEGKILQYLSGRNFRPPLDGTLDIAASFVKKNDKPSRNDSNNNNNLMETDPKKINDYQRTEIPPFVGRKFPPLLDGNSPLCSYIENKETNLTKKLTSESETLSVIAKGDSDSILANWKPSDIQVSQLEEELSSLFSTLKFYGIDKNEVSTKQVSRLLFGDRPNPKRKWLVDKAEAECDRQRHLVYSDDVKIIKGSSHERPPVVDLCYERTGLTSEEMTAIEQSEARALKSKAAKAKAAAEKKKGDV